MTSEHPPLHVESYTPRGTEFAFFRSEKVNATMIDPTSGARLNELANTYQVDVRRTHDDNVAMISSTGRAVQEALGNDEFSGLLNAATQMAKEMADMVIPDRLVNTLAEGDERSFRALGSHVKTCLESCIRVDGELYESTLLGIGGQSMSMKMEYKGPQGIGQRIFVVKVPSPLTLLGFSANSIPIIQPYFGEMLRREILNRDPRFQQLCSDCNFSLSRLLYATNYLAIEEWIEGETPQKDDADVWRAVAGFSEVMNEILEDIRTRSPNEQIRIFMSSVRSLDTRVMSDRLFAPPEASVPKVVNFIKKPDGTIVCIDPFIPLPLRITEVVQHTPFMTNAQRETFSEALGQRARGEGVTAPF